MLTDTKINRRLALVLGWERHPNLGWIGPGSTCMALEQRREPPDYLSDWNGAQRVVEAMLERGWAVYMQSVAGWGHQCSVTEKDGSKILGHMTRADTLPRALALAALQALEAEE